MFIEKFLEGIIFDVVCVLKDFFGCYVENLLCWGVGVVVDKLGGWCK